MTTTMHLHMHMHMAHQNERRQALRTWILLGVTTLGGVACGDLAGNAVLPAGTQSPNAYNTPAGAVAAYRGVKLSLQTMRDVVRESGALTDELMSPNLGSSPGSIGATGDPIDERVLGGTIATNSYSGMQRTRGNALETLGLLATYAPEASPALRGEMYAIGGYMELLLADLYCSGVPLSTVDFQGDFTYEPGSTSAKVYQHALTLFDSALAISSDSQSVMFFAQVAKGRTLLELGQYADAATAVAAVPDTFQYRTSVGWSERVAQFQGYSVSDSEGINGLPFVTANDPRVSVVPNGSNQFGISLFIPAMYPAGTTTPVVLASGVEARLIQAEAALQANPTSAQWLAMLNALRTTCTTAATCPAPAPAGTGGVAGLPPLSDPGNDAARVNLLFHERAYWLFLTGHRQGDLRRLVRNYHRNQQTVYPTGPYFGGLGSYGSDVNLPIPDDEYNNPLFHGCISRGA